MSSIDETVPLPMSRYERKREAILVASAQLFNARGVSGTTLADVAQSVGLTTTSVTYYYRRKEDLAAACVSRTLAALDELVALAEREAGMPARVRRFAHLYFAEQEKMAAGQQPSFINFWDLRALTGDGANQAGAAFSDVFRRIRRWFGELDGVILTRAEQNARAHLVFSAMLWAKEWLGRFEQEDYGRAADAFADVLIDGFAAPAAAWEAAIVSEAAQAPVLTEVSREGFLRAATELINEQGYRGASVDRISAKLSVTKGSFYHHNSNKDDLVAQCFARSFDVVRAAHRAAPREFGTGWARLCRLAANLVRFQQTDRGPLLRYSALSAMPPAMRPQLLLEFDRLAQRTVGIIVDGIVDGSIRPIDPTVAALVITGAINAAAELHHWVHDITEHSAVDLFARPSLLGVGAPPTAA